MVDRHQIGALAVGERQLAQHRVVAVDQGASHPALDVCSAGHHEPSSIPVRNRSLTRTQPRWPRDRASCDAGSARDRPHREVIMSAPASRAASESASPRSMPGRRRAQLVQGTTSPSDGRRLSLADVQALQADPSPENRVALAAKFGRQYDQLVSGETRPLADAVLELLVRDVERKVRQALAEAIAGSPNLPSKVAVDLARDEIDVARPILERSPVLSDADLADIVRSHAIRYALAVAGRERLSEHLSDLLADTGEPQVVARLVGNVGAQLSAETLSRITEDHSDDCDVQDRLIRRSTSASPDLSRVFPPALGDRVGVHHEFQKGDLTRLRASTAPPRAPSGSRRGGG
jgi:hypothetical protein